MASTPHLPSRLLASALAASLALLTLAIPPAAADPGCTSTYYYSTAWPAAAGTDYGDQAEALFEAPASAVSATSTWGCFVSSSSGTLIWTLALWPTGDMDGSASWSASCGTGRVWYGAPSGVEMATYSASSSWWSGDTFYCRYSVPASWFVAGSWFSFRGSASQTYEWEVEPDNTVPYVTDTYTAYYPFHASTYVHGGAAGGDHYHPVCYQDVPTGLCTELCVEDVGCTPNLRDLT